MNQQGSHDREALLAEIAELFVGFSDGELYASEEKRLAELLQSSPEAREHYLRLANLRVSLHWRMRMARDEMLAGVDRSHALPVATKPAANAGDAAAERRAGLPKLLRRLPPAIDYRTHPVRFAGTALALTLLIWAAFFTYMWPWMQTRPAAVAIATPAVIAEIVDTFDAKYSTATPGRYLIAGKRLQLTSGVAVVRYRSGPSVVLQGPADYVVTGGESGNLQRGKLTARLDAPGQKFEVTAPTAVVRDRGTEFGLLVDSNGDAHVHVFQGRVDVARRQSDGREVAGSQRLLSAGQSLSVRTSGIAVTAKEAVQFVRWSHLPSAIDELAPVPNVTYHLPSNPLDPASAAHPQSQYPDDGVKLMDGRIGLVDPGHRAWVGWSDGHVHTAPDSQTPQPRVEFDLRGTNKISSIEVYYLVFTRSAVHAPTRAVITLARDSEFEDVATTFTSHEFAEEPGEQSVRRALIRFPAIDARFARIDFYNDKQWTFLSEIRFLRAADQFPQAPASPATVSSDPLMEKPDEKPK